MALRISSSKQTKFLGHFDKLGIRIAIIRIKPEARPFETSRCNNYYLYPLELKLYFEALSSFKIYIHF